MLDDYSLNQRISRLKFVRVSDLGNMTTCLTKTRRNRKIYIIGPCNLLFLVVYHGPGESFSRTRKSINYLIHLYLSYSIMQNRNFCQKILLFYNEANFYKPNVLYFGKSDAISPYKFITSIPTL